MLKLVIQNQRLKDLEGDRWNSRSTSGPRYWE